MLQPIAITFEDYVSHLSRELALGSSGKFTIVDPVAAVVANPGLRSHDQDHKLSVGSWLPLLLTSVSSVLLIAGRTYPSEEPTRSVEYRRPTAVSILAE